MARSESIVLVHGIYMHGLLMRPLAKHLQANGFTTLTFNYPSLRHSSTVNAARLAKRVEQLDTDIVHYVGHSLGGLVLRHLLAGHESRLPPGRCVTLGTPHRGSLVADWMQRRRLGWLLGASRDQALLGGAPDWPPTRDLGSLAGIARRGIGRMLVRLPEPHDGTVAVAETHCPGMRDHVCILGNHTCLLYSSRVPPQIVAFLRSGRFDHDRSARNMSGSAAEC